MRLIGWVDLLKVMASRKSIAMSRPPSDRYDIASEEMGRPGTRFELMQQGARRSISIGRTVGSKL